MRTDVKIGLAIGGVLLAVLVVYMLIVPGGGKQSGAPVTLEEINPPGSAKPGKEAAIPSVEVSQVPNPPAETATEDSGAGENLPADANSLETVSASGENWDWTQALASGQMPSRRPPPLMSSTPVPTGSGAAGADSSGETADSVKSGGRRLPLATQNLSQEAPDPSESTPRSPRLTDNSGDTPVFSDAGGATNGINSSSSRSSGKRTHVVQPDETFSSISAAAYGSPNYWAHIARANPGVNPKALRPGMVIQLPDSAQVKIDPSVSSSSSAAAIDSDREYRVRDGDSLYKISIKLYGKSDRVDAIYALNKQTIGADPQKLKVNMLLKLPEAPTVSTAASR